MSRTVYVLGFCFDLDCSHVVLILKSRPDWQAGKFNGVGGHLQTSEAPEAAMAREFGEEACRNIAPAKWRKFCLLHGEGFAVHCLMAQVEDIFNVRSGTEEKITVWDSENLPPNVIPNLRWLIPMAKSFTLGERCKEFNVEEAA